MWATVLHEAVEAAASEKKSLAKERERDEARRFIKSDMGMFSVICAWLGLPVKETRAAIMAQWKEI